MATTSTSAAKSNSPGSVRRLNLSTASPTPISAPNATARANDRWPASTNASIARAMVSIPRLSRPAGFPIWADRSMIETVDRSPAMVHTKVETILGLTVDSRDSGGLSAEASTARPNVVRRSSHASPTAAAGTTIRMLSCGPVIRSPRTSSNTPDRAVGVLVAPHVEVGVGAADPRGQLGHAHRGHQHYHPRRAEQPPYHQQVDDGAEQGAGGQAERQRQPEREVVVEHQERQQRRAHQSHVADGQVHHPGGPVHQDQAHGQQPGDQPVDQAVEHQLRCEPGGKHPCVSARSRCV